MIVWKTIWPDQINKLDNDLPEDWSYIVAWDLASDPGPCTWASISRWSSWPPRWTTASSRSSSSCRTSSTWGCRTSHRTFSSDFFSLFGNLKKFFYVVCFCLLLFKFETISDENNKKTLLLLLFGGSTDRVKRVKNNVLIKFERSSSDLSRFKVQKVFRPGKYFHSDWAKKKKNNNDDDDDRLQREQVNPGLNPDQIWSRLVLWHTTTFVELKNRRRKRRTLSLYLYLPLSPLRRPPSRFNTLQIQHTHTNIVVSKSKHSMDISHRQTLSSLMTLHTHTHVHHRSLSISFSTFPTSLSCVHPNTHMTRSRCSIRCRCRKPGLAFEKNSPNSADLAATFFAQKQIFRQSWELMTLLYVHDEAKPS